MSKRPPIKTKAKESASYWSKHVDECGLSVDWSEAETHCWRCGCEKNLQRCHIIPHALDGKDEPGNIVLLCSRCHADGPNMTDPEIMWDWIRAYGVAFCGTFWVSAGMKEYKFIYNKKVSAEIKDILESAGLSEDEEEVSELVKTHLKTTTENLSKHFGQPYFNTATIAGQYRMMLKNMAKSLGVSFPIENSSRKEEAGTWWFDV